MSNGKAERTGAKGTTSAWLPGQRRFLFRRDKQIFVYDVATRREKAIHSVAPHDPWLLRVSKDGRKLYYSVTVREGEVWLGRFQEKK
jgi:hypothetical protein